MMVHAAAPRRNTPFAAAARATSGNRGIVHRGVEPLEQDVEVGC
jgi:hypothetical protein